MSIIRFIVIVLSACGLIFLAAGSAGANSQVVAAAAVLGALLGLAVFLRPRQIDSSSISVPQPAQSRLSANNPTHAATSPASRIHDVDMRAIAIHLEQLREIEKHQLARVLHDEFGSALTALAMRMAVIARQSADDPAMAEQWAKSQAILSKLSSSARRIQSDLRPADLQQLGIKLAFTENLQTFQDRTGIVSRFDASDEELEMSDETALALLRMMQELAMNVVRHAGAQNMDVILRSDEKITSMIVTDNGCGFDADRFDPGSTDGLRSVRERAQLLGGEMRIESKPGQGVKIEVTVPATRRSELPDARLLRI